MKLLLVPFLMVIMEVIGGPTPSEQPDSWPRTTGSSALDLRGKMFTLSRTYGGVTFYPPYYDSVSPSTTDYPTRRHKTHSWIPTTPPTTSLWGSTRYSPLSTPSWTTNRRWNYPWTTESPTRGVSVCLRYMADNLQSGFPLFTLSPNRSPLSLEVNLNSYGLTFSGYYNYVNLRPLIKFWPNIGSDFWTSVCLTVDTRKGVVQMFSGSNMSIRKVLPSQYVWSGEPVIDFPGFDGQLTDIQMWDYPLRYKEIFYYMNRGYYGSYSGSVLSWSYIRYSLRGRVVMEDSYGMQAKEPIRTVGRKHRLKKDKLKFFSMEKDGMSEDQKTQVL
ncbi:uncharacterized protein LOC134627024 [Pelmatolapia mariae]|uniref:uncharacterized protein LOC134627024 n=1 Tax=Pelmatolapia mariae TaxID=158779 RepID=UPI002FE5309B